MEKRSDLNFIPVNNIERNPENPRLIFDPRKMNELQESINSVGILVPLIVYFDDKKDKYILLDGERRWRCAEALKLRTVPANIIAKPSKLQNILQMFNIHNVRIEWGPMEVAWKLKTVMEEAKTEKESELTRMTSLKPTEIRKSKILLSYDWKYQELVHKGPTNEGIKQDFLVELKPTLNWLEKNMSNINKNNFIDVLIGKHKKKIIDNYVTGFRNLSKIIKSGLKQDKLRQIFLDLANREDYSIEDALEASVKYKVDVKEIEKRTDKLLGLLKKFKIKRGEESDQLIDLLKELKARIDEILKDEK